MKTSAAPHIGLLLILSWFTCFPVAAGNWKRVAEDKKSRVEIDVATLARDGNSVKAWERETYRQPEQAKPGDFFFTSVKTLAQHHCTERTTTYLFRGYFAADGSEIKTLTAGTDMEKVAFLVPDSMEERKLTFACSYGAKKTPTPLPPPVPADSTAEPPAPPTKPAAAKTAENTPKKDEPPAKSAGKDSKTPAERSQEKTLETKSSVTAQPSPAPSSKTPAGK